MDQLIPVHLTDPDEGVELRFHGRVLAVVSSQRARHLDHRGAFASRRERCAACRWLEVTIYRRVADVDVRLHPDGHHVDTLDATYDYVVHTVGRSEVPGERQIVRITETDSAYEVVEALTVRRGGHDGEVFMPPQHLRALAAAAQHDDDIRDAYINRAVV